MKYKCSLLFLVLFLITFLVCDTGETQYSNNNFDIEFKLNDDGITYGYQVKIFEGPDTTQVDYNSATLIGFFRHDTLVNHIGDGDTLLYGAISYYVLSDSTVHFVDCYLSDLNGEYLVALGKAQGFSGLWSDIAMSPAFQKEYITIPPGRMRELEVKE
jgi:hypothetical protein